MQTRLLIDFPEASCQLSLQKRLRPVFRFLIETQSRRSPTAYVQRRNRLMRGGRVDKKRREEIVQ
jgi:hypothetical protein